jgi:hypothetical protein
MRVNQQVTKESTSAYSHVEDRENWRENKAIVSRIARSKRAHAAHAARIGYCLRPHQGITLIERGARHYCWIAQTSWRASRRRASE